MGRGPSFPLALRPEGSRPRGMEQVSGYLFPLRLWQRLQPLAVDGHLLAFEAERFIERLSALVSFANHEFEFRGTTRQEPETSLFHEFVSKAFALKGRIDGKVVDPASMTILAGHDRSGELVAHMADEDRGIAGGNRPVDVIVRVIPGPRQAASLPERNQHRPVRFPEISHMHRHNRPVLEDSDGSYQRRYLL